MRGRYSRETPETSLRITIEDDIGLADALEWVARMLRHGHQVSISVKPNGGHHHGSLSIEWGASPVRELPPESIYFAEEDTKPGKPSP